MSTRLRLPLLLGALAGGLAISDDGRAGSLDPNPDYALVGTLPLPGPTRWDYLAFDSQGHRLFITRGDRVDVLDVTGKTIVGTIPDTNGVHGVALAPELGKGFISDGGANAVTVFDLASLRTLATVPTGTKPDAIVYDPATQRVFAANGGSGDLTAIDARDGTVLATITLGGQPEFAVVDGKGRLYVNLEDKSQLAVVDPKDLKVLAHHDLAPGCDRPSGLAIDSAHGRLFSVCRNKAMVVVEAATGRILETLPIGASSDAAIFDPGTGLAFSSNGEGTLTVVGASAPDHYQVLSTVTTLPAARTMALDPSTHRLYLAAAEIESTDPPTETHPHPRPHFRPDSFMILTVGPKAAEPR